MEYFSVTEEHLQKSKLVFQGRGPLVFVGCKIHCRVQNTLYAAVHADCPWSWKCFMRDFIPHRFLAFVIFNMHLYLQTEKFSCAKSCCSFESMALRIRLLEALSPSFPEVTSVCT